MFTYQGVARSTYISWLYNRSLHKYDKLTADGVRPRSRSDLEKSERVKVFLPIQTFVSVQDPHKDKQTEENVVPM